MSDVMPPPVVFSEIPSSWRVPGTYVEVRPNYSTAGLGEFPAKALLFVQKLAAGTAVAGQVYRLTRAADAIGLFGQGSIGHQMVAAFKAANPTSDLYAAALADNGSGVAATQTVTVAGTPTVAGTVALYIAGTRVTAAVSTTSTATTIAAALVTAIAANADLPVTAANTAGVITLTARHKGECGNEIDARVNLRPDDVLPAGVTVVVAAGTAGSGNPDIATLIAAVASEWYTDLVVPWVDATSLAALSTELARRYTALSRLDTHAFVAVRGSFATLTTKGGTLNSPYLTAIGANGAPQPGYFWAAALAGVAMAQSAIDPARQLRGLVLPGLIAPASSARFYDTERDLLLRAGISTFTATADGGVALERVITTYRVTSLGAPDTAYLDLMVPKTLTRIRWDWGNHMTLTWPRAKLAQDGALAAEYAANVATPRRIHSAWAARSKLYGRQGWIEDIDNTVAGSTFQINASDRNRMDAVMQIRIIGNLMVLAGALEFDA